MGDRRIEYMPLNHIQGALKNPKLHSEEISKSLDRFGYTEPVLLDERTGRLVAGHGRVKYLLELQKEGGPPPDGVTQASIDWLVPVTRGWASKNDTEADAYLIASNRLTTLGGWDDAALARLLEGIGSAGPLAGVGFDSKDVERLLRLTGQSSTQEDTAPPLRTATSIKRGDCFRLGPHWLMCGDSTQSADVGVLLGNGVADVMVTDPPYGVAYAGGRGKAEHGTIENDDLDLQSLRVFLHDFFLVARDVLRPGAAVFVCHADHKPGLRPAFEAAFCEGFHLASTIVWVKQAASMGWQDYRSQYEPILFGWKPGKRERLKDRTETNVWEINRDGAVTYQHPTQKPVELFARALRNHTEPGAICFEPFSGSGTCLVAAHQLGRICYAMELDPRYVQVSIDRWEALTGEKAAQVAS